MPLRIKSSYEALLYFIEDKDIIDEICQYFYYKDSYYNFEDTKENIWKILAHKTNDNRHHHYTSRKSLEYLQYKLSIYKSKHTLYNLLKYLYLEHFEVKRGRNILRIDQIESFQFLQNTIDVTPIYSMSISEYLEDYTSFSKKIHYIKESIENNNIPLPNRFLSIKNFSDNHFHLGGGNNYNYRLHKMLQEPLSVNPNKIPDNNRLYTFKEIKNRKFIVYATSILEQILIGFIVNYNDKQTGKENLKTKKLFRNSLRIFSKAIIDNDLHLLDIIVNNNQKEYFLFDIRPKMNRAFLNSLQIDNYYNELIYHIVQ